jgi:hypothetical protein
MDQPVSSLHSVQLRAVGKTPVLLYLPGELHQHCAAIRATDGTFSVLFDDGWMLILHRDEFMGRPLDGDHSWYTCWDDAAVCIEVLTDGTWVEVEEWKDLQAIACS